MGYQGSSPGQLSIRQVALLLLGSRFYVFGTFPAVLGSVLGSMLRSGTPGGVREPESLWDGTMVGLIQGK